MGRGEGGGSHAQSIIVHLGRRGATFLARATAAAPRLRRRRCRSRRAQRDVATGWSRREPRESFRWTRLFLYTVLEYCTSSALSEPMAATSCLTRGRFPSQRWREVNGGRASLKRRDTNSTHTHSAKLGRILGSGFLGGALPFGRVSCYKVGARPRPSWPASSRPPCPLLSASSRSSAL